jgi:hypothetical protein
VFVSPPAKREAAVHHASGELGPAPLREHRRDERRQRAGGHRGQVAQVHRQRLASGQLRRGGREGEIDALHQRIHRGDDLAARGRPDHCGVVPDPQRHPRIIAGSLADPGDQIELMHDGSPS